MGIKFIEGSMNLYQSGFCPRSPTRPTSVREETRAPQSVIQRFDDDVDMKREHELKFFKMYVSAINQDLSTKISMEPKKLPNGRLILARTNNKLKHEHSRDLPLHFHIQIVWSVVPIRMWMIIKFKIACK